MKKILSSIAIVLFILPSFGQQIIQLKSGERMNGKIEKVAGDTVVFNFKGSKIKLATAEIHAIYFDDSLHNNDVQKNSQPQNQEAKLFGVITYFFNENYGDKPDIGANIYIIEASKIKEIQDKLGTQKLTGLNPELISKFHYGYFYRETAAQYRAFGKDVPSDITNHLIELGVETDEKYKKLEDDATHAFILFTMEATKLTTDGSGSYSTSIKPGTYIVIIQSSHRKNINVMESRGVIDYNTIIIEPSKEKNLSFSFPVN